MVELISKPQFFSDHFEGDIAMSQENIQKLLNQRKRERREVTSKPEWLWPNAYVPFTFAFGFRE